MSHVTPMRIVACAFLAAVAVGGRPLAAQNAPATDTLSGRFYTEDQAKRGEQVFARQCAFCHAIDATPVSRSGPAGRGLLIGDERLVIGLGGGYARRYPSVYYIFQRVRDTMPPADADSMDVRAKVDAVAYILQVNGFPAGRTPLTADAERLKAMRLDELGFEHVFNGRDFANFKFLLGPGCHPPPAGCGKTDPAPVFSVQGQEIVNTGKVFGYMYTEKKYLNFALRFDYRFVPPADWEGDDRFYGGNSGYFLFVYDHWVFPRGLEIQGQNIAVLSPGLHSDLVTKDTRPPVTNDAEARKRAIKPVGQWNAVEIVSRNGEVTSYLNGTLISTISKLPFTMPGHIAFQSSGGTIHWRNIRIKAEDR